MEKHNTKQDIERFINLLDIDELIHLNNYIVKRMRLITNAKTIKEIQDFDVLDRVFFFDDNGNKIIGTVIRLNQKTVTIKTDDERKWRVSPYLLKKIY